MDEHEKHWRDLPPATRRAIPLGATLDLSLRAWAIIDLLKRPEEQVKGNKSLWAVALAVVSSAGALPIAYLVWARKD